MKLRKLMPILGIFIFTMVVSCEKEDENEGNEVMVSSYNDDESHNAGKNCMNCHSPGGHGEGWFTVAGTVYNSNGTGIYPNATIILYTEPNGNGTLVKTIEVDKKGNFYTTEAVNFENGLYAIVTGEGGTVSNMISAVNYGQCNSCHGSTTGKISAE